jgi:hypothetical protein
VRVLLLAFAEALSDSTPVLISVGAALTIVAVTFGAGISYAKTGARMAAMEDRVGRLEAKVTEVVNRLDAGLAAQSSRIDREVASLKRGIAEAERDASESDGQISSRVHRLGDIAQDLAVRMAQAETHLGYDGRGQTTPVRPEPPPRPRPRRSGDPAPDESR